MKVKIEIKSTIQFLGIGSSELTNFYDERDYDYFILRDIEVIANGEDITKKKGKYVMVEDMIGDRIRDNYETPALVKQLTDDAHLHAEVELDVEDFDPKKLQLRKCVYEFNEVPYAIDGHHILYDGELIELSGEYNYRYEENDVDEDMSFEIE